MEKKPYSLSYVRPAQKWCLTYFTADKTKKNSDKQTQHQEWFDSFNEAEQRGRSVTGS